MERSPLRRSLFLNTSLQLIFHVLDLSRDIIISLKIVHPKVSFLADNHLKFLDQLISLILDPFLILSLLNYRLFTIENIRKVVNALLNSLSIPSKVRASKFDRVELIPNVLVLTIISG